MMLGLSKLYETLVIHRNNLYIQLKKQVFKTSRQVYRCHIDLTHGQASAEKKPFKPFHFSHDISLLLRVELLHVFFPTSTKKLIYIAGGRVFGTLAYEITPVLKRYAFAFAGLSPAILCARSCS